MDRGRRRRRFSRDFEDRNPSSENFRFPLDIGDEAKGSESSPDDFDEPSKDLIRQQQQKILLDEHNSRKRRASKFTISKAREVPSAIHGTKKGHEPDQKEESEAKAKEKKDGGYVSPLVEELKRQREERARRQKKKAKIQHNQYQGPLQKKGMRTAPGKLTYSSSGENDGKEADEQNSVKASTPFNVIMTPYDKKKSQSAPNRPVKRSGPKNTLPPLEILGQQKDGQYELRDEGLGDVIVSAFQAIGVPTRLRDVKTNGVTARYELSLDRNFRLNVVGKLKEHLLPYLPFDDMKIIAPITGTSNIGIEFMLPEPYPISFATLFTSSSLRLRKNDYKFVMGKTVDDQIFSFLLPKAGHILLYGGNEAETSSVIDNILVSLLMNHSPDEFRIHVASDKAHYDAYKDLPHMFSTPKSIGDKTVLEDALNELNDRHNQFRRANVRNLSSYNQRVSNDAKKSVIVVVIDDLSDLFEYNNPEAIRAIVQLLKKGKPLGMHLILNHSRSDVGIRFELLQQMQTRLSFKDEKSKVIDGSNELAEGNDMLVQIPISNQPVRVNAGVLTPEIKQRIFSHIKGMRK
ncbi:hypothetical protein GCM10022378_12430 [Salinicoccus jeotgali]|uniref:FtsK domain-containing protein n=1 Tax=Salinicoccus jeotgali TaxID=381634 RepID=A0ABP7ES62_9STAP